MAGEAKRRAAAAAAKAEAKRKQAAELAVQINDAYAKSVEAYSAALAHAIDCGEMLRAAKKLVGHGGWLAWLKVHCPEIPERTATLYMKLAKNAPKLEEAAKENGNTVADLSIRGAIRVLTEPKADEDDEDEDADEGDEDQGEGGDQGATENPTQPIVLGSVPPNPIPSPGELCATPRSSPITKVVDAISAEPAPDVITAVIKQNLDANEQRQIAKALDDTPPATLKDLMANATDLEIVEALEAMPRERMIKLGRTLGMAVGLVEPTPLLQAAE
jgi:hypothetical protein